MIVRGGTTILRLSFMARLTSASLTNAVGVGTAEGAGEADRLVVGGSGAAAPPPAVPLSAAEPWRRPRRSSADSIFDRRDASGPADREAGEVEAASTGDAPARKAAAAGWEPPAGWTPLDTGEVPVEAPPETHRGV